MSVYVSYMYIPVNNFHDLPRFVAFVFLSKQLHFVLLSNHDVKIENTQRFCIYFSSKCFILKRIYFALIDLNGEVSKDTLSFKLCPVKQKHKKKGEKNNRE